MSYKYCSKYDRVCRRISELEKQNDSIDGVITDIWDKIFELETKTYSGIGEDFYKRVRKNEYEFISETDMIDYLKKCGYIIKKGEEKL